MDRHHRSASGADVVAEFSGLRNTGASLPVGGVGVAASNGGGGLPAGSRDLTATPPVAAFGSSSSGASGGALYTISEGDDTDGKQSAERQDRHCWRMFRTSAALFALVAVVGVYHLWDSLGQGKAVRANSFQYFLFCMLGGVLSGIPHMLITPLDLVKCRMQVGEYASTADGFAALKAECAGRRPREVLAIVYRGWAPTLAGYCLQGAFKFGFYEYFKYRYAALLSYETVVAHRTLLFLAASASAELIADCFLSPWEAVKVRMQTARFYPPLLRVVMPRIWALEGPRGFFKCLVPLWCRQVPYTMVKFATFERTVVLLYTTLNLNCAHLPKAGQLVISLLAGYIAGLLCAVVSHPADSIVSKLNQRGDARSGVASVLRELGCKGLWKGLLLRIGIVGTLTALQWLIYDGFKVLVGLRATGGCSSG